MSDTLYRYYEEELVGFRQEAKDFSDRYPAAAGRLRLDASQSADPHVERLIQSFSFLNARIRKKLDDDYPELTDSLLSILYPHFLAPVPSMTTAQFHAEPSNLQPTGMKIEKHSSLRTKPVNGVPCRFRTAYPIDLWPIEITDARLMSAPFPEGFHLPQGAVAALKIQLTCTGGMRFEDLSLDSLRMHFDGDSQLVGKIYELIFNQTLQVSFESTEDRNDANRFLLNPEDCIHPVGFTAEEALLPYPKNSFVGFQLLTELFAFPAKFAYMDLSGFRQVAGAAMGKQIEVTFFLSRVHERLEQEINNNTFRLGCTPIVNLFEKICEPIQLSQKKYRYKLTPDVHHPDGMEVYSVDTIKSADPHNTRIYHPFYSFHRPNTCEETQAFWYASRSESLAAGDAGTDVYLHTVDPDFDPRVPAESALTAIATCTNRDLPLQLQHVGDKLTFELEAAIPLRSVNCLQHPTSPLRAPMRRKAHWKLVSHLTLNHLSIVESDDSLDSLRQMLSLYDFSDANSSSKLTAINRQMAEGIRNVSSRRVTRRIGTNDDSSFCRGLQIALDLDEEKYIGVGSFLFSSVIRHFFTKYASINSFVELVVTTKQREQPLKHWDPLVGNESLT